MRTSSKKTTAAVLRGIIGGEKGIKVPEWAEMLKCSPHSIHDLESGRLKLSEAMATKMNFETGISVGWLLNGDPTAPPIAQDDREYSKAIYDEVQAKHFATVDHPGVIGFKAFQFFGNICAILVSANRKQRYHLALYRTAKAIQELRTEFGEAKELDDPFKALAYVCNEKNFENVTGLDSPKFIHGPAFKPESKQPLKKKKHR